MRYENEGLLTMRMQVTFARCANSSKYFSHNGLVVTSRFMPVVRSGQKPLMRGVRMAHINEWWARAVMTSHRKPSVKDAVPTPPEVPGATRPDL